MLGEAVFNTSMTGYQEVVTDPSYHGQLVTFTYPLIGNYGVSDHLLESAEVRSRAIVVREVKNTAWNQSCAEAWVDWLSERGVVGVGGIDTRALTRRLREHGAMNACVAAGADLRVDDLLAAARELPSMAGSDLVSAVTCAAAVRVGAREERRPTARAWLPSRGSTWWPTTSASSAASSGGWRRSGCQRDGGAGLLDGRAGAWP